MAGRLMERARAAVSRSDPRREAYERDGYFLLEGFVPPDACDQIATEAAAFYERRGVAAEKADRTMNFHVESPTAAGLLRGKALGSVLTSLMGAEAVFLQSIYFNAGSEQAAHSDYMYMSTEPDFQLCGFWLACEDVDGGSGPLFYYPGSHRLIRQNVADYYSDHIEAIERDIEAHRAEFEDRHRERMSQSGESLVTCELYFRWLTELHGSLEADGYERELYLPRKGDAIVWHGALVHGGSPVSTPGRTRKSLVGHFLTRSVTKYYDMNYVDRQHHMTLESIDRNRPAEVQIKP